MILYLSFEQLTALAAEADGVLAAAAVDGHGIAAPPQLIAEVEQFALLLDGDINLHNLDHQRGVLRVVDHLVHSARGRMERLVTDLHPAAEEAVAAYFDYAHLLTVRRSIHQIGIEMAALVQVMTGEDPESDSGRRFSFPD